MDNIKIKVAKDYLLTKMIYESDCRSARSGISKTYLAEYGGDWIIEEVTLQTLQEYISNGYAIKINC